MGILLRLKEVLSTIGTPDSTPATVDTNVWLWKSTDHGRSWTTLEAPDGGGATKHWSYDADLVASPDGWVYVADWWIGRNDEGQRNDQVLILRSSNEGRTWQSTPAPLPPNVVLDREYLLAGPDGLLMLFYHRHIDGPNTIEAIASHDHGATWSLPEVVVPAQEDRFPIIAHPILVDGTVVLPYGHNHHEGLHTGLRTDLRLAVQTDDGWEHRQFGYAPRIGHLWPLQAAANGGHVDLVWARDDGDTMSVWMSRTPDLGRSWQDSQKVVGGGQHIMPWASAHDGVTLFSWYDARTTGSTTNPDGDAYWHVRGATWNGKDLTELKATTKSVHQGPLCSMPGCDDPMRLGDYQSNAIGPDQTMYFAYAGNVDGEARVFVRAMR